MFDRSNALVSERLLGASCLCAAILFTCLARGYSVPSNAVIDKDNTDCAVEVDEPMTAREDFRSVRFGIFRTLKPRFRFSVDPARLARAKELRLVFDDGDDMTRDDLSLSTNFSARGTYVCAVYDKEARDRLPKQEIADCRVVPGKPELVRQLYVGENRLRITIDGRDVFTAYFLLYPDFEEVVVGTNEGTEPVPDSPNKLMMSNHIMLWFDPDDNSDASISRFLFEQRLRPQGIVRNLGLLQVRPTESLRGAALLRRIDELKAAKGSILKQADIDLTTGDP